VPGIFPFLEPLPEKFTRISGKWGGCCGALSAGGGGGAAACEAPSDAALRGGWNGASGGRAGGRFPAR